MRGRGAQGRRGPTWGAHSPSTPRKDTVSVVDTYQYLDPEDAFSREPFVVKFSAPGSGEALPVPQAPPVLQAPSQPLTSTSCSCRGVSVDSAARGAAPSCSRDRRALRCVPGRDRQVGHLRKPLCPCGPALPNGPGSRRCALGIGHRREALRARPLPQPQTQFRGAPQDMLFLGDFNADCSYVQAQDWLAIRLRSSEVFKWLIPDSADTTVGNSDCAYDRIVLCGARLRSSLKPQSAAVYDFQEEFGLYQVQASAGPSRSKAQPQYTWHSPPCTVYRKGP